MDGNQEKSSKENVSFHEEREEYIYSGECFTLSFSFLFPPLVLHSHHAILPSSFLSLKKKKEQGRKRTAEEGQEEENEEEVHKTNRKEEETTREEEAEGEEGEDTRLLHPPLSHFRLIGISLFWLVNNISWTAINMFLLQDEVVIVGGDDHKVTSTLCPFSLCCFISLFFLPSPSSSSFFPSSSSSSFTCTKGSYLALVLGIGSGISCLTFPIFGARSDTNSFWFQKKWRKRKPFLLGGSLGLVTSFSSLSHTSSQSLFLLSLQLILPLPLFLLPLFLFLFFLFYFPFLHLFPSLSCSFSLSDITWSFWNGDLYFSFTVCSLLPLLHPSQSEFRLRLCSLFSNHS
jgi:hypothetical protein